MIGNILKSTYKIVTFVYFYLVAAADMIMSLMASYKTTVTEALACADKS